MAVSDAVKKACLGKQQGPQSSNVPGVSDMINGIAKTLDKTKCVTKEAAGGGISWYGVGGAYAATSSGCETTAILANIASSYVSTAACVIQTSSQKDSTITNTNLSQKVRTGDVTGCDFDISQKLNQQVTIATEMNEVMKNDLESVIKSMMENVVTSVQDTKKGLGSTMPSGSSINVSNSELMSATNMSSVMDSVKASYKQIIIDMSQEVLMGNYDCRGARDKQITISQEAILTVIASNLIGTAMEAILGLETFSEVKTAISSTQINETDGFKIPSMVGLLLPLLAFVLIAFLFFKFILPMIRKKM